MSGPYTGRSANEVAEALGGYEEYLGLTSKPTFEEEADQPDREADE